LEIWANNGSKNTNPSLINDFSPISSIIIRSLKVFHRKIPLPVVILPCCIATARLTYVSDRNSRQGAYSKRICAINNIDFIVFSILIGYGWEHTREVDIEGNNLLLNQYTRGSRSHELFEITADPSFWLLLCLLRASVVYIAAIQ
jgi:hypothetical protein